MPYLLLDCFVTFGVNRVEASDTLECVLSLQLALSWVFDCSILQVCVDLPLFIY